MIFLKIAIFFDDLKTYQVYRLPAIIDGNYWVTYKEKDGSLHNFLNVYAKDGSWCFEENGQIYHLENFRFYDVKNFRIYVSSLYDDSMELYSFQNVSSFTIGQNGDIAISSLAPNQLAFLKKNSEWLVQNNDPKLPLYINQKLFSGGLLHSGDCLFFQGLELVFFHDFISMNRPFSDLTIQNAQISKVNIPVVTESLEENLDTVSIYEKKDYFYRSPRFRNLVSRVTIKIDAPPQSGVKEEMPFFFQMASMLTMGMSSMVTLFLAVSGLFSGEKNLFAVLPSLLIGISMLAGMLLIPVLTRKYQKKQTLRQEKMRQEKYLEYLADKKNEIHQIMEDQQTALKENSVSLSQCEDIILHHRRNLWERKIEHDDFLMAHIGIGEIPAFLDIQYPEEHFSLDSDNLKQELQKLGKEPLLLREVPINFSFVVKNVCAILGNIDLIPAFLNSILLQFITFHSYEDVKFVIFTNKEESERWKDLKDIPYLWNNERTSRYYGETKEEKFAICNELNEVFQSRREVEDADYRDFLPYYVIITDDFASIRDFQFVKNVLKFKKNVGFSFLIINQRLMGLPNECNSFLNIDANQSGMIENELSVDHQTTFQAEFLTKSLTPCYREISNIPIEFKNESGSLPQSISFLEMYNVGKVSQLNALNRWKSNLAYESLAVPVGVDQNGSEFVLDLHEKMHGPHGLIAGMTGSGKSEFIITYILSMAINFHPDDVSFVLIDYKGGGLAGAFENKELGVKLPHLAGTITNLDTVEIKRSLASIESELKRRQRLFNEAREKTNESTINIYKYQKLYHEGKVEFPIPHLFIICDEFAELKTQQPEFMAQLISTARIGRSLGVHLILATQKPSGVVDAQIWSNSKFRVCLKVQDRSDSMDMIKVPDAASLSVVGRFYLQVGYNEFFALGQSAWCGAPYYEMDERKKKIDSSLDYINNRGKVIKSVEQGNEWKRFEYKGEELPAILKYLTEVAAKENVKVSNLWLPSIPEEIFVSHLEKKYAWQRKPYLLNEIIGEYDDPETQTQGILTMPLSSEGNALVYGATGSGKENFLTTFFYSAITHHTPDEVQFYLFDFGAETFTNYRLAPHVGDVITSSMQDKITKFFPWINEIMEQRKKLFLEYGGNYFSFLQKSEKKVPNLVIVINNYDNFKELYPDYDEEIVSITRECSKYGIYFLLSVVSSSGVRLKLAQNFKLIYSLQMNSTDDYANVLGNVQKTYPSKKFGRGILRMNGRIHEFQTAFAFPKDVNLESVRKVCELYREQYKTSAPPIPVLPEHVYYSKLQVLPSADSCVVGIDTEHLKPVTYFFKKNIIHFITGQEMETFQAFTTGFVDSLGHCSNSFVFLFDTENLLEPQKLRTKYVFQNHFYEAFQSAFQYLKSLQKDFESHGKEEARKQSYAALSLVIYGSKEFLKEMKEHMEEWKLFLQLGEELEKLEVFFIDAVSALKSFENESWVTSYSEKSNGIWIGSGITSQYFLKLSKTPNYCYQEITNYFGYVLRNGNPIPVKLIEGEDHE